MHSDQRTSWLWVHKFCQKHIGIKTFEIRLNSISSWTENKMRSEQWFRNHRLCWGRTLNTADCKQVSYQQIFVHWIYVCTEREMYSFHFSHITWTISISPNQISGGELMGRRENSLHFPLFPLFLGNSAPVLGGGERNCNNLPK